MTMGMRMPITPQLVPVANAVSAANANTMAGKSRASTRSPSSAVRYCAAPSSALTLESAQASINTITASSMVRQPTYQASIVSARVRRRRPKLMAMATSMATRVAHNSDRWLSAAPITAIKPASGPAALTPVAYRLPNIVTTSVASGR